MLGLMQNRELMVSSLIVHAARHHGAAEVVSRREDGRIERTTYAALERRSRRLMGVLREIGVTPGDRVATLAMNSDRHLELYYAISGMGAVCHTVNPRLSHDDIAYIAAHAEDKLIFADPCFLGVVEAIAPKLGALRGVVVMGESSEMKPSTLSAALAPQCYETLLEAATAEPEWPDFDENSASSLCYTSGTTGRPKGVLYSHRSTVLHAMTMNSPTTFGLRAVDRILPVVPMFHANAWGLPFAAPMAGATLVMPGRHDDPSRCSN